MLSSAERKARSEEICRSEGIPVHPTLPLVENEKETRLRNVESVAWRAMCLCLVAMKGEGMPHQELLEIVDEFGLGSHFSPHEHAFVSNDFPTQDDLDIFSWRYECYWVLLWALGFLNDLGRPDKQCDVECAVDILWQSKTTNMFIGSAKLRSISEILDSLDLTYRYDWACVEARMNGNPVPGELHFRVVYERHYALNWIVNYMDQEWDDITCDT